MASSSSSSSSSPSRIELQIGEKTFHTTRPTLAESPVLTNLVNLEPPYFLDADPALFEHILRYLRTGIFPLFHDAVRGHDICLYHVLLGAARFYQVARLADWIEAEGYFEAVTTITRAGAVTLHGDEQIRRLDELAFLKNETLRIIRVNQSGIEPCYSCPRGVWRHNGHREDCVSIGCMSENMSQLTRNVKMKVLKVEYVVNAVEINEEFVIAGGGGISGGIGGGEGNSDPPPYQAS